MKKQFVLLTLVLFFGGANLTNAAVSGFANNPSNNSGDFLGFVASQGATVNSNVNFDTHATGALQSNFYTASDGVTLTETGAFGNVQFGAGPGQGNTFSPPLSNGEGLHAASNFLFDNAGASSLTVSFNSPVEAAGLFVIDYFGPFGPSFTLTAFAGANGGGANLGTFSSLNLNLQPNNLYFIGAASNAGNEIGSIVYSYNGIGSGDETGVDNILFATVGSTVPEPASVIVWSLIGLSVGVAGWRRRGRSA